MRLHLNKKLRAALIAAITAVGFTLPQAQAYTQDVGTVIETNWFYCKPSGITGRTLSAPEFDTINLTSDGTGYSIGIANLTTKAGGLLHIVGGNHWGGDRSFAPLTIDTIHAGEDGSGQVFIEAVPYGNKPVANTTVEIKAIEGTLAGLTNNAIMTLGSEGSTINALHTLQNAGADASLTLRGKFVFDTADAAGYTVKQEGQVVWSDAEKEQGFKTTTGSSYYLIKGAIEGGTLEVTTKEGQPAVTQESAGNYYFTAAEVVDTSRFYVNADTATLDRDCTGEIIFQKAGATLTVAENITFTGTITRNGYATSMVMATGAVVNSNALTLAGAATLNLSGPGTFNTTTLTLDGGSLTTSTNLNITASGNETVKGQGGASSLIVNGGTTTITGGIHYTSGDGSKVEVGTGQTEAKLVTGRLELGDTGGGKSYLNIGQKGTLVITSTNDASGGTGQYKTTGLLLGEWGQQTHASVAGKLYAQNVKMYHGDQAMNLTIESTGVVAVKGISKCDNSKDRASTITNNGGKLVLGEFGMTNNGGDWTITLNGGEIGMYADTTTLGRDMSLNGNVTFNTAKYEWSGTGAAQTLTQGETGGTMTISGNIAGAGTIIKKGAGELILSGENNVLSNTIQVQAGTLTMSGTYEIGAIKGGDMQEYYVDANGDQATNGFYCQAGTKTVYSAESATVNDNDAKYTIGGVEVDVTGGVVTIDPTVDYTTLYVKNGSEAFAAYKAKAVDTLTKVDLAAGTSVTMDYDAASITLVMHGDASVNATAATTLGSISGWSDNKLTITGEGAVALLPSTNPITLAGSTKLDVQGNVATKKLILNSANAALDVAEGATLTTDGNLTPTHGTVNINGTASIGGELDLSNNKQSDVNLIIGSKGAVTATGMWMHNRASITLEQGGEYDIKGLAIIGKEGGAITYIPTSGDASYGTGNADFQIANATVTATDNVTLGNTLVNSGVVSSAHQVTLSNASSSYAGVTVSGTGSLVVAADSNIAGTSSLGTGVTINGANTLTNSGTMDINGTIVFGQNAIQNNGTITLGDSIHFNLTGLTAEDNKYTLFSGNAVDLSMYDASRITIAGKDAYNWTFGQDGTITFALNAYTWNGGAEGVWDYETPCWNDPAVPFAPGYAAQFDSSATVAVTGAIEASKVIVSAGNEVTLTEGTDGYLTADELAVAGTLNTAVTVIAESYTIAQGGTWNIQGEQALVDGTNEGTIHVDTTGDVMVWSDSPETALAGVKNDGKVGVALANAGTILNMGESNGTLEVYSGAISYLSVLGNQTVELDSGSKLLFGNNAGTKDDAVFANDIVMNGDATVQVWGSSKHSSATISGDVSGAGHTLTKTDGDQSLVFSGVVTLGGLTTASDGHGTIVFNGGAGSVGYIKTLNAVTIQFSAKTGADNVYSFESFNMSSDDNQTNATRWLVVDSGVTLNGTGTSRKYGSTIENSWGINGGGLEINGTLNTAGIIAMDAGATTAYIKGSGLINTKGLDLCNNTKTYIQDGITINITSDTGIYKRNNNAEVHLLNATLQATDVDWAIKDGGTGYKVTLDDAEIGTTFDVAADRTITIANILGGEGKLVKTGEGTLVLSNENTHTGVIDVREGKLVVEGTIAATEVTLGADASIENKGSSPITLSDVDEQLKQIENLGSSEMTLRNTTGTLEVEDLTIGAGSTVSFYDKADTPAEGTITVTETLTAGGGTLLANLVMEDGSTLNVNGGDAMALTLGSQFNLAEGALVTLDEATLAAIADLENIGDTVILVKQYQDHPLTTNLVNGDWSRTHFDLSSITDADYQLFVTDSQIGLVKSSNVPEPTTGTLSLLALAALAARRRRK